MSETEAVPKVLYHYCDVGGFMGIMQNRCLRLSHVYYMNDYKEHQWLLDEANKHILELAEEDDHEYIQWLRKPFNFLAIPFICCFSEDRDLLSQWRAYSDDGKGFAIGFSRELLAERLKEDTNIYLTNIEYDREQQHKEVEERIRESVSWVKKRGPLRGDLLFAESMKTKANIWNAAARCKNPGFQEEREWRIIMTPSVVPNEDGSKIRYGKNTLQPLKFRQNARSEIVSFFELPFAAEMVTEIRLGPKNYARDYRRDTLDTFLAANGFPSKTISVVNSETTYR